MLRCLLTETRNINQLINPIQSEIKKMKKILLLVLTFFSLCLPLYSQLKADNILINIDKKLHSIHPNFWGTNILFWIDDDSSLADGNIASKIKNAGIKLLRYPGGTVADNFHWETNTLDNVNMFPYEDGKSKTDFDEFIRLCRTTGAAPSCVLNTESWVVKNDIPGGAHEAANWLRYCKKKGYNVKFWEIGNETYWHPVMSAEEYADLINVYADSLKKIDPNIILGINGHWSVDFTGTKERLKDNARAEVMQYRRNINSKAEYEAYKEFVKDNTRLPVFKGDIKWWKTLAERCGKNIDMLIVHWYFSPGQLNTMSRRLAEVKSLFTDMYPGRSYLFNMSEYNTTKIQEFNKQEHIYLTEAVGAMLKAEMDFASFWPMRLRNYGKSTLLDYTTHETSIIYQIHQQLAKTLKGSLVEVTSKSEVPAFASYSDTNCTLVLTGRLNAETQPVSARISGGKSSYTSCNIWRIVGNKFQYEINTEKIPLSKDGSAVINVNPQEVVIAEFK